MPLSTSDWVTISTTAASIVCSTVVSVAVVAWQVRRSSAPRTEEYKAPALFDSESMRWLRAQLLPAVGYLALGLYFVIKAVRSEGPVDQTFVIQFVCGALLLCFWVVYSVKIVLAAAFRPTYLRLNRFSEGAKIKRE